MAVTRNAGLLVAVLVLGLLLGCSSVTFTPLDGEAELPPKPDDFVVKVLDRGQAGGYRIIGVVSYEDSDSSSVFGGPDRMVMAERLKESNLERLADKVRDVGGEALIDVRHEISAGGPSGGVGGGVGVGMGSGGVGVGLGVGVPLLSGGTKVYVLSWGDVGVAAGPAGAE